MPQCQEPTLDALRRARKEQVMQVACRVQAEYGFRLATREPTSDSGMGEE